MRTLIEHHPELIGLAALMIPLVIPFIIGYLVGRERAWKKCEKRNAKFNDELEHRIVELTRSNEILAKMNTGLAQECEDLGGSITRVFPGNMQDPNVLDAAFTAMTKIRRRAPHERPDNTKDQR